jgi:hypothetical protein
METASKRFSLLCDPDGRVIEILSDESQLLSPSFVGAMLFSLAAPGELNKILNFFLEIKEKQSAVGWDINIITLQGPDTFTFVAGMFDNRIGIAAATTQRGAQLLFTELTRINNEQTNLIRTAVKQNASHHFVSAHPETSYYEEFSQLNNELVNIQRELAKKNRELDELNKCNEIFISRYNHRHSFGS